VKARTLRTASLRPPLPLLPPPCTGSSAEANARRQGKKPCTLDFLGLTHICVRSRKGKFTVHVRTMKKRYRRGLTAIAEWCQENRHVSRGRAAENPMRPTPGPLPVLRTADELPKYPAVLSGGLSWSDGSGSALGPTSGQRNWQVIIGYTECGMAARRRCEDAGLPYSCEIH
jgi:hypothetical protein